MIVRKSIINTNRCRIASYCYNCQINNNHIVFARFLNDLGLATHYGKWMMELEMFSLAHVAITVDESQTRKLYFLFIRLISVFQRILVDALPYYGHGIEYTFQVGMDESTYGPEVSLCHCIRGCCLHKHRSSMTAK